MLLDGSWTARPRAAIALNVLSEGTWNWLILGYRTVFWNLLHFSVNLAVWYLVQLFVKDNQSCSEKTQIDYLGFIGTPVNATNMSDFKRVSVLQHEPMEGECFSLVKAHIFFGRQRKACFIGMNNYSTKWPINVNRQARDQTSSMTFGSRVRWFDRVDPTSTTCHVENTLTNLWSTEFVHIISRLFILSCLA